MRISDWSSDVCSSDLASPPARPAASRPAPVATPVPDGFERPSLGAVPGGDPRPTWALKSVLADARRVGASVYTVRRGDTLRAVGAMTGAGSEAIAMENDLAAPYALYPGQQLRIPAGLYHRVAAGETGIGIAQAYGVDWGEVITINALSAP